MLRRSIALATRGRCFSSAAAKPAGQLYICGTGESNKLGTGNTRDIEVPTAVEALADVPIVHVNCGRYHTAALSADGDVYAWGLESSGQLGVPNRPKAPTPTKVEALCGIGVRALSCGLYHTLALTEEGDVYSFGFGGSFLNGVGGLGSGDRAQIDTPTMIADFKATAVSAGGYHSVALDADGAAYSWGRGEWGRLGHNDSTDCYEPTVIDSPEIEGGVTTILAGDVHTGALTRDGRVCTWGRNENWQLGYEVTGLLNAGQSLDAQQEPQVVELPDDGLVASKLACGELGTAALMSDGKTVYVWGMVRTHTHTHGPDAPNSPSFVAPCFVRARHATEPMAPRMYVLCRVGSSSRIVCPAPRISKARLSTSVLVATTCASPRPHIAPPSRRRSACGSPHPAACACVQMALLTDAGRMYSFGTGPSLGLARTARKQWELVEVTAHSFDGKRVLDMHCGPYTTAMIVEP